MGDCASKMKPMDLVGSAFQMATGEGGAIGGVAGKVG